MDKVVVEKQGRITTVIINRPEVRNAVDGETAALLAQAFREFDADPDADVAILTGTGGYFCAGADLKAVASEKAANRLDPEGDGPMGPSRMQLAKPVIAAVAGPAVAGGLELALWCDLRVAEESAVFGVYCRRWGVPLIDGGTVRLPRLIGHSRAMDMILTGRAVPAREALDMGLANRVVADGTARAAAETLAGEISRFPQLCMRNDRLSACEQWGMQFDAAMDNEFRRGLAVVQSGETVAGAGRFAGGAGRHGSFADSSGDTS
ncbi:MAG: crotonase/enoyl-CoA hydratase family protein [Gammaproteobacteria bacterium]|nr:crotonase/enoyl-CoA hydratase family protein [Gammaproteobacteria bacterium]